MRPKQKSLDLISSSAASVIPAHSSSTPCPHAPPSPAHSSLPFPCTPTASAPSSLGLAIVHELLPLPLRQQRQGLSAFPWQPSPTPWIRSTREARVVPDRPLRSGIFFAWNSYSKEASSKENIKLAVLERGGVPSRRHKLIALPLCRSPQSKSARRPGSSVAADPPVFPQQRTRFRHHGISGLAPWAPSTRLRTSTTSNRPHELAASYEALLKEEPACTPGKRQSTSWPEPRHRSAAPSAMVYCGHCADYCPSIKDPDKGYICCGLCGKVIDQEVYTDEPTFIKESSGQSRLAGKIMSSIESGYSLSHERTLAKGRDEISLIVHNLHVGGGDTIIDKAHKLYQLAVEQNFTRGRRTTHVAAACLYIACRQSKKAYLLIDFSDYLQISVYVLGAVFLQLCQVLLLSNHPIVQKLIDPSLFIHRFTERLLGKRNNEVSETALRILASMKRDWMQTGRKPSGLCGAALYIAALSHGLNYTKADIVSVVHVCEATLTKRLIEFENTDSGSLTIEEFLAKADESSQEPVSKLSTKSGEILCKHKNKGGEHFAHGLCEKCYNKFTELSGGLEGGADPPAFQRAEKQRLEAEKKSDEAAAIKEAALGESTSDTQNSDVENTFMPPLKDTSGDEILPSKSVEITNDSIPSKDTEGEKCKGDEDPESLSDIDDVEVDWYLHNEEEKQYKKIIWEEMNKEYLEEQAAKEALAAELAARGVGIEDGKKKKRKRNEDAKISSPAETPAEATYNMLKRKGLMSKINVEAVGGLYNTKDEDDSGNKKEEMDFDGEYTQDDNGDTETFDHGYDDYADHKYRGYDDDGGEADDVFDFL